MEKNVTGQSLKGPVKGRPKNQLELNMTTFSMLTGKSKQEKNTKLWRKHEKQKSGLDQKKEIHFKNNKRFFLLKPTKRQSRCGIGNWFATPFFSGNHSKKTLRAQTKLNFQARQQAEPQGQQFGKIHNWGKLKRMVTLLHLKRKNDSQTGLPTNQKHLNWTVKRDG